VEYRRWNDILALKTNDGKVIGFHSRNLEVAELSEDLWNTMRWELSRPELEEAFSELETWNQEKAELNQPASQHKIKSITLNVAQICNLQCVYCAAGGDGTYGSPVKKIAVEKTIPQLKFLLDKLAPEETFQITYLGGEPLLYPEGIQILGQFLNEESEKRAIQIKHRIVTNGTLLTEANVALLKALQAHVVVSLDGTPEITNRRRPMKNGGNTAEVIEAGLQRLKTARANLGSLTLAAVFGKDHLDVHGTFEYYAQFQADHYDFNFDHDEKELGIAQSYVEQMSLLAQSLMNQNRLQELEKISFFERLFANIDSQNRVFNYCGAGKSFVMIDAKNNIFPCVWSPNDANEQVGSGTELNLEKLLEFQQPLIEKEGCATCWARHLCGGGCMYVHERGTGSKHIPAQIFCYVSRSLISLGILYYYNLRAKAA